MSEYPYVMNIYECVKRIKLNMDNSDCRYVFFIGAGCSISSDIPGAYTLTLSWLERLSVNKDCADMDLLEFTNKTFHNDKITYTKENLSLLYGQVFESLFLNPVEKQREIEKIIEGKTPGIGYSTLAQLITNPNYADRCNILLTTNFDDMLADSFYLYTEKKPLVIVHDSLISYIRINYSRPVIIKLHGDAKLYSRNTDEETQKLDKNVEEKIKELLKDKGLIFIGYGGHDQSIYNLFKGLSKDHLSQGIWWINKNLPESKLGEWLKNNHAIWVQVNDFDEFMLYFHSEFELKFPEKRKFDRIFKQIDNTIKNLLLRLSNDSIKGLEKLIKKIELRSPLDYILKASIEVKSSLKNAEDIYLKGMQRFKKDITLILYTIDFYNLILKNYEKANLLFKKALNLYPNDELIHNIYGTFLSNFLQEYDAAEVEFKKGLELDSNDATIHCDYGIFLTHIRKCHDGAEVEFKKALELDSNDARIHLKYGTFLTEIRKSYNAAEVEFKKALELDSNDAAVHLKYGNFLTEIRKNHDAAEIEFKKALELDSNNAIIHCDFGYFLTHIRKNHDAAEVEYKKALELDSNNARIHLTYGNFLIGIRKTYDAAEVEYKKALELDSNDAIIHCDYGDFLTDFRKSHDAAEVEYKKALELDSNDAIIHCDYGNFLTDIRKSHDAAEIEFKKALELNPTNAENHRVYGIFLTDIRKSHDAAEIEFKKALELNPTNAENHSVYGIFLTDIRKSHDAAEIEFKKAIELDSNEANYYGNYAKLLYIREKKELALENLKKAESLNPSDVVSLESNFYLFAHEQNISVLHAIHKAFLGNIFSPNWILQENVNVALKHNHPYPEFLIDLADVIAQSKDVKVLEKYPIWKTIINQRVD